MRTKTLIWTLVVIAALAMGLRIYFRGHRASPPPTPIVARSTPLGVIALPSGATIVAPPHSVAAEMVAFLASHESGPRRFEPGGYEYIPWSNNPTPAAEARLNAFAQILKAYPDVVADIIGNTDNDGERDRNQRLSEARAAEVVRKLGALGIDERRLTASGVGMDNPIASNATEEGRSRNRRISVILRRPATSQERAAAEGNSG
jgi:hypothetical protein